MATRGSPLRSSIGARSARGGYPARDGWKDPQQNKVLKLVLSTHLKKMLSQIGSFSEVGVKIKHIS